jgi:hypothetical protein
MGRGMHDLNATGAMSGFGRTGWEIKLKRESLACIARKVGEQNEKVPEVGG